MKNIKKFSPPIPHLLQAQQALALLLCKSSSVNFLKTGISLKYDFKHILNDFIHVYSPRAGTDNPLGTKFCCQQKFLITLPVTQPLTDRKLTDRQLTDKNSPTKKKFTDKPIDRQRLVTDTTITQTKSAVCSYIFHSLQDSNRIVII